MNRKAVAAVLAMCILCGVGTVWGYFFYGARNVNALTVGANTIRITEEYQPPEQLTVGDNVFRKRVQVENTGSVPCFVRVFADFSDSGVRACSQLSPDGTRYYPADQFERYLPEGWVYLDETSEPLLGGFFYYTESLMPKEKTAALWEKVKTSFANADQIRSFDIIVCGESVQVKDCLGEPYTGAEPWKQAWTEFLERR